MLHGEVRLVDVGARPDYAVEVAGATVGYIEIKRPGKGAEPERFSGHDARQWQKLRLLPNVLYCDGAEFALYRSGERAGRVARLQGKLTDAGIRLQPADHELARLLKDFLYWSPQPPRSIRQLVHAVAGLCRLLRAEVRTAIQLELSGQRRPTLTRLAGDWRNLLFPDASDEAFTDQYAQTVTFALLLARVEGIAFDRDVAAIARKLGKKHLLMGKALDILTTTPEDSLGVSLDTLLHVIGAVDWDKLDDGSTATYPYLYEEFLADYDPVLRQQTGSYYTPNVVEFMVSFTDELLRSRLHLQRGFASQEVVVVDPAMGTGSFLLNVIEQVVRTLEAEEGPGAVGPFLRDMAARRLIGFEKQAGPYAVAELRLYDALQRSQTEAPAEGLRIYVADTLDDPYVEQLPLGAYYDVIAESRAGANRVKRDEHVMVVICNPPYDAATKGAGKWIESGRTSEGAAPLDAFRARGNGRYEYVLTNQHVYFWRWATWKAFDQFPDTPSGVVAFISPSAYLKSQGFAGFREYLRRTADEGWIIDVSPEGHQPDTSSRLFPDVQQPLAIAIFSRRGPADRSRPATIHHLSIKGSREEKLGRLRRLRPTDPEWAACPDGWRSPFRPSTDEVWIESPALPDLFLFTSRGVTPGRTWVYSPDPDTLDRRWDLFLAADRSRRRELFREARDRKLDSVVDPLPGITPHHRTLADETGPHPAAVRVGYRSFDRQWVIPDSRLMVVPRPDLWSVRGPQQIYVTEQNAHPVEKGPGLTFSAEIPDMDHYDGRSGRAIPLYRDPQGAIPNLVPGLLEYLSARFCQHVTPEDFLAYIAGCVAHPGYVTRFHESLQLPGIRVPLTEDRELWSAAVATGREVLWLHTFGTRFVDDSAGRPAGPPRLPRDQSPSVGDEIPDTESAMPERIAYEAGGQILRIGTGSISPVPARVWGYESTECGF